MPKSNMRDEDRIRLRHMIDAAEAAEQFVAGRRRAAHCERRLSSRHLAGAARCRVGGIWAGRSTDAQLAVQPRMMGDPPPPAPQVARLGH
jgi:hypothetical protein